MKAKGREKETKGRDSQKSQCFCESVASRPLRPNPTVVCCGVLCVVVYACACVCVV